MTIPSNLTPAQTRQFLQRQVSTGRYMLLGTVIITLAALWLLLSNQSFYIPYHAALAYFPVYFGKGMDNDFSRFWELNGTYTFTGFVMGAVVLVILLTLWLLSKNNLLWLKVGIGVLVLDTLALLVLTLLVFDSFLDSLWQLVLHGAVIWEMCKAVSADKMLKKISRMRENETLMDV